MMIHRYSIRDRPQQRRTAHHRHRRARALTEDALTVDRAETGLHAAAAEVTTRSAWKQACSLRAPMLKWGYTREDRKADAMLHEIR